MMIGTATIMMIMICSSTIFSAAYAQQQEKFFMIMKLQKPTEIKETGSVYYQVSNITTNMKNFNQGGNNKVEYSLRDVSVFITDSAIYWTLPFKIIDTTIPNVIKTRQGSIGINSFTEGYEKQYNILTNITTYTGKSVLFIDSGVVGEGQVAAVPDLSLKAVIYPNMTGTLEMRG
jgi:hypothetical protein